MTGARFLVCGLIAATLLVGTLTGCAQLVPWTDSREPPATYLLAATAAFTEPLPQAGWQLTIEEPVAPRVLDTDGIALQPAPLEFVYFAESRWSDRAPEMIQRLMVAAFTDSGAFAGVGSPGLGLRSEYVLITELRAFQAELRSLGSSPVVRVRLHAKLMRQEDGRIVAARLFEQSASAATTDVREVVQSFDAVVVKLLHDLVSWVLAAPPVA